MNSVLQCNSVPNRVEQTQLGEDMAKAEQDEDINLFLNLFAACVPTSRELAMQRDLAKRRASGDPSQMYMPLPYELLAAAFR